MADTQGMVGSATLAQAPGGLAGAGARAAQAPSVMALRWVAPVAVALFAIGMAAGIVLVDDHPNAQKLQIASDRVVIERDNKIVSAMVLPCMRLLASTDGAAHRVGQ